MVATDYPLRPIEVIFSSEDIALRIADLAEKIARKKLDNLVVIPILTGSFVFAADLIRALHDHAVSPEIDFLSLSSYHGTQASSGEICIDRDLSSDIQQRNVLIVDDILESGRTLSFAKDYLAKRGALNIFTCVLLNKRTERAVDIEADFYAFDCPNVFVVGYGMDLDYKLRELPFIGQIIDS